MKRLIQTLMLGAFVLGLGLPPLSAQPAGNKIKEKLGLPDEQAEKLKAARKAKRQALKPLREQLSNDMDKLRAQIKDKAGDGDIQATLNQLELNHKAIQAENEKFKTAIAGFLSATQRAKLLLAMTGRMKEGWKGREMRKKGSMPPGNEDDED